LAALRIEGWSAKKTFGDQNSIRFSEEEQYFTSIARKLESGKPIGLGKAWIVQMPEKMLAIDEFH